MSQAKQRQQLLDKSSVRNRVCGPRRMGGHRLPKVSDGPCLDALCPLKQSSGSKMNHLLHFPKLLCLSAAYIKKRFFTCCHRHGYTSTSKKNMWLLLLSDWTHFPVIRAHGCEVAAGRDSPERTGDCWWRVVSGPKGAARLSGTEPDSDLE